MAVPGKQRAQKRTGHKEEEEAPGEKHTDPFFFFPVRWRLLRYSVKSDLLSSQETQKSADSRRKSPLAGLGLPHVMGVHAKT